MTYMTRSESHLIRTPVVTARGWPVRHWLVNRIPATTLKILATSLGYSFGRVSNIFYATCPARKPLHCSSDAALPVLPSPLIRENGIPSISRNSNSPDPGPFITIRLCGDSGAVLADNTQCVKGPLEESYRPAETETTRHERVILGCAP